MALAKTYGVEKIQILIPTYLHRKHQSFQRSGDMCLNSACFETIRELPALSFMSKLEINLLCFCQELVNNYFTREVS